MNARTTLLRSSSERGGRARWQSLGQAFKGVTVSRAKSLAGWLRRKSASGTLIDRNRVWGWGCVCLRTGRSQYFSVVETGTQKLRRTRGQQQALRFRSIVGGGDRNDEVRNIAREPGNLWSQYQNIYQYLEERRGIDPTERMQTRDFTDIEDVTGGFSTFYGMSGCNRVTSNTRSEAASLSCALNYVRNVAGRLLLQLQRYGFARLWSLACAGGTHRQLNHLGDCADMLMRN
jgi:hypothetical protein